MGGELILTILAGAFLFFICSKARENRKAVTRRCPKCGTTCNANGAGTRLRNSYGGEVYRFKCPNCGNDFYAD
jgi:transposase